MADLHMEGSDRSMGPRGVGMIPSHVNPDNLVPLVLAMPRKENVLLNALAFHFNTDCEHFIMAAVNQYVTEQGYPLAGLLRTAYAVAGVPFPETEKPEPPEQEKQEFDTTADYPHLVVDWRRLSKRVTQNNKMMDVADSYLDRWEHEGAVNIYAAAFFRELFREMRIRPSEGLCGNDAAR